MKAKTIKRNRTVKIIAISLPFIVLILIELLLRLVNYGQNYDLFVTDGEKKEYIGLNPNVPKKYFSFPELARKGIYEPFKRKKDKTTTRIFVLGESSGLGFPYFHSCSFHNMLMYRLQRAFPDRKVEIINLSLTAICSYTLWDFSHQIVNYEPDAILIYTGHNEYYGALGIGSTNKLFSNPTLIRLTIKLRSLKLVQLFYSILNSFKSGASNNIDLSKNMMRLMASKNDIPYNSTYYNKGIKQFENNLDDILNCFNKSHIPVFISDVVSNEKDLPPFVSNNVKNTSKSRWDSLDSNAQTAEKMGDLNSAINYYRSALKIDSTHAKCNFMLAQIYYKQGLYTEAKKYYAYAKDFDMLRFRAPEKINEVIYCLSKKYNNTTFVSSKSLFESNSPHGIIGNELITEHVHPNTDGYFYISEAFFRAILKNNFLNTVSNFTTSTKEAKAQMPIPFVDSVAGNYLILSLKSSWPFNEHFSTNKTTFLNYEDSLAYLLAIKKMDHLQAYNLLYKYYENKHDYIQLLKIHESFLLVNRDFVVLEETYYKTINLCEVNRDFEKAYFYSHRIFKLRPCIKSAQNAMLNSLRIDKPETSIQYLNFLITNTNNASTYKFISEVVNKIIKLKFTLGINVNQREVLYSISKYYASLGDYQAAYIYSHKLTLLYPTELQIIKYNEEVKKRLL